jgi:hypothetical protein
MNSPGDVWLCLLLLAMAGGLLVLRLHFPNASKRSETLVLVSTAVLYFSICNSYLRPPRAQKAVTQARR